MRAHIRSVKPEALSDEALWDLEQETGLPIFRAFVGLWTQADREGRFEWRHRPLKAAVLPYWDGDFSRVLDALASRGFVVKYVVDDREYGLVRSFKKHQLINNREAASILPPPPRASGKKPNDSGDNGPGEPRVNDASTTGEGNAQADLIRKEQKGAEGSTRAARASRPPPPSDLDSPTGEPEPPKPKSLAAQLLDEWNRQTANGHPGHPLSTAREWIDPIVPALEARGDGNAVAAFGAALTGWLAKKTGKRVQLDWFCKDLPDLLAKIPASSAPTTTSRYRELPPVPDGAS
jgi:hypothetical protein